MKDRLGNTVLSLTLSVGTLFPSISAAQNDGNSLLQQCRAGIAVADLTSTGREIPDDLVLAFNASACVSYLRGFRDLASFWEVWLSPFMRSVGRADLADRGAGAPFCIPDNVDPGQLARVIVKYLESHPETLHEADVTLTVTALLEAFPCKRD